MKESKDVRKDDITKIIFSEDIGFPEEIAMNLGSNGVEEVFIGGDRHEAMFITVSKDGAKNMIKALDLAIKLGWLD